MLRGEELQGGAVAVAEPRRRHAPFLPERVREVAVVGVAQLEREVREVARAGRQAVRRQPRAQPSRVAPQAQPRGGVERAGEVERRGTEAGSETDKGRG